MQLRFFSFFLQIKFPMFILLITKHNTQISFTRFSFQIIYICTNKVLTYNNSRSRGGGLTLTKPLRVNCYSSEVPKARTYKTGICFIIFYFIFVENCLYYDAIHDFSVWLRTGSNLVDINRFRKDFLVRYTKTRMATSMKLNNSESHINEY